MWRVLTSFFIASACVCTAIADNTAANGYGPSPVLPKPDKSVVPTIDIAPAKGWSQGQTPLAASSLKVALFAEQLDHPRWLYVLPNGDVLVAETNAPVRPDEHKGVKGAAMKQVMEKAGAGVPSANRITLLRDTNGDGTVDTRSKFIEGLNSPFGMALVGSDLYVANSDAVVRFKYQEGQTSITTPGERKFELPAGPLNHHWTKNIIANSAGTKLYATVGSNSNVAENGMDKEDRRAAILELDLKSGQSRVFASGLRNPNGMAWNGQTLWTVVNERDEIGDNLVPDYLTSVKDGGFYGWPYSYFGQNVDERVKPQRPELVAKAIVPEYGLGSHTASLGLVFNDAKITALPERYKGGAFIGQHGSWNRKAKSGYKVVFVPFANGKPSGMPEDVLTGFLNKDGEALGRPVGVAIDKAGALLIADDVGNKIWRVTAAR